MANVKPFTVDTEGKYPINAAPRRHDPVRNRYISLRTEELLEGGQISKSHSPWSSPVVLILKQGSSVRFCIDYRKLNAATVKDSYPLPNIGEVLDLLGGQKYFSSIDMAAGYWQVPIDENDKEKKPLSQEKDYGTGMSCLSGSQMLHLITNA